MPSNSLRLWLRTLRGQLTLWNTIVVLLISGFAMFALRAGLAVTLEREAMRTLEAELQEIQMLAQKTWPDDDDVEDELERKELVHQAHDWFAQWARTDGTMLWISDQVPAGLDQLQVPPIGETQQLQLGDHRILQTQFQVNDQTAVILRIGASNRSITAHVSQVTQVALPMCLAIGLLAPIGGYWLAGRATAPLQRMIATTATLRPSQSHERLPLTGSGDELDLLSKKINSLLDRLASYVQENRDSVANSAHELRSPLTAIQSAVEVVLAKPRSTAEYEELLESIADECERLTRIVNQLLTLAQPPSHDSQTPQVPVPLTAIASRTLDMLSGVAQAQQVTLRADLAADVTVSGESDACRQLIHNLLDNALKFTPSGGTIDVRLAAADSADGVQLTITDTGIGIPPDAIPHLFERFYKVDTVRHRALAQRGSGLGLCICQKIVTEQGGTILIDSIDGQGTTAKVFWPRTDLPAG